MKNYVWLPLLFPLVFNGCNFWSPLDSPSGDTQLLSAARACLDSGDYDCALKNYQKLSSADADIQLSEEAMVTLNQSGATMAAFLSGFGASGTATGEALTIFANSIIPAGPSQTSRMNIYGAYKNYASIGNPHLQAFIRFLTALALAGEILAEAAHGSTLAGSDLAVDATSCKNAATLACSVTSGCDAPAGSKLAYDPSTAGNLDSTPPNAATPTIQYLVAAITAAQAGLTSLGTGGDFGSTTAELNQLQNLPVTNPDPCYRQILLQVGIGTDGSN